jgi:hypothetical protein
MMGVRQIFVLLCQGSLRAPLPVADRERYGVFHILPPWRGKVRMGGHAQRFHPHTALPRQGGVVS